MKKNKFYQNVILFLPLLLLYILVVLIFSKDTLIGDESRHVGYAYNLSQGFYSDTNNPELRNGPGYPLVLVPFIALDINLIWAKYLNAIFVFLGIVYFKKTLSFFTKHKYALIVTYAVGLYPPLIRWIPFLYSEPLAFLLMCGLSFQFYQLIQKEQLDGKLLIQASVFLAFLVLTKIIFLHVIGVSFFVMMGVFLISKNQKKSAVRTFFVFAGSFVCILPYVVYAFFITGKPLLLGTGSGEILYHHATPYENEWGNWFSRDDVLNGGDRDYKPAHVYTSLDQLSKNHRSVYVKLEHLTPIQRDSALKAIAFENMKTHPVKYLKNTVSNMGRFLFHYPFSYRKQDMKAYGYLIPNMFIVVLWILSLYPFYFTWRRMPFAIRAIMFFAIVYAFGIILSEGRGRNFIIMVPALVLFSAFVYTNLLKISLVKGQD